MKQKKAMPKKAKPLASRVQERKYLFDKPENVSRLIALLAVICGILFILDFVLDRHSSHAWDTMPGFYALYGFIGCVLLVIIAKWLRLFLMRPPSYYHKDKPNDGVSTQEKNKQGEDDVAP